MVRRGICVHHKALGRYAAGNKRCQVCEVFIKWDGFFVLVVDLD